MPTSERSLAAWRVWLKALASDAEAALAAALTYEALPPDVREIWLDALDVDVPLLGIPKVAVYAPLLAVEEDDELRLRIMRAMGPLVGPCPWRAWKAEGAEGAEGTGEAFTVVLARTLYLHFVELLICKVQVDVEILSAAHEPLTDGRHFEDGMTVDGAPFECGALLPVSLDDAVEMLAHAVVAQQRRGHPPPDVMVRFSDLFTLAWQPA